MPKSVEREERICHGVAYFMTEEEADEYAREVQRRGRTYVGGWRHGEPCGRDKSFDINRNGVKLYAVTD